MARQKNREFLMRSDLPYGIRRFENGAEELFNRKHEVIIRRGPDPVGDPVSTEYLYNDSNPPWQNKETLKKCENELLKIR